MKIKVEKGKTCMRQIAKRAGCLLILLALLAGLATSARAAVTENALEEAMEDTARYLQRAVPAPQVGSIGGEWAVLSLARSGLDVPEAYYQNYREDVEAYVREREGILHTRKYTEYSRVVLALSAIGVDARDVAGFDLTMPLGDFDKTVWQGINGGVWALLALDSAGYPMPVNPAAETQATRQMYIDYILEQQRPDGGWSLTGKEAENADPDLTGMALQALAKYQDQTSVARAVERALSCMSEQQGPDGGFVSWNTTNLESCAQMIVALCELEIPLDDTRFVKNGKTMLDHLMTYYQPGKGFLHTEDGAGSNQMATEQGLYGLAAIRRALKGENSLYRMGDALPLEDKSDIGTAGLANRHADVKKMPVTAAGKTFSDVSAGSDGEAIRALAERGIIDGVGDGTFDPNGSMTRASFAAIVVRALGLTPQAGGGFSDVPDGAWYADYVGTAAAYGIITGTGDGSTFEPEGNITRQEAAVMTARAAALCGLEDELNSAGVLNTLAQFPDYVKAAEWARPALAFCYHIGILDQNDLEIRPLDAVNRAEVAQMLFCMLDKARLL